MTFSRLPLSYCTNVHPGRTVEEVVEGITRYTSAVRQQVTMPVAAGLWLADSVATELVGSEELQERVGQALWENDLTTYTLNAFPFGDFHSDRVKEQVYLPDWTSPDRVRYTRNCATLLSRFIPKDAEGSISTVPLGGRMNPAGSDFHAACFRNLIKLARFLHELHNETGRMIRLAVEPEPMCHLSSIPEDTIPQFRTLFEMADAFGLAEIVRNHIGLCFDVCHQAVVFEDVQQDIEQLTAAGIRINKIHITNAIELEEPLSNPDGRQELCKYVEPRYLHQTYARMQDGRVLGRVDLLQEDILRNPPDEFLQAEAWRVHFHVPVYAEKLGPLNTTRPDLVQALKAVRDLPYAPHLEVETYTWPVMPDQDAGEIDLSARIARELTAAADLLTELNSP